jgi:hypothetical protein
MIVMPSSVMINCFWINLKMETASYTETLVFAHGVMSQMTYYLQQATFS